MITLTINNSYSQITGLTTEPFNKLRKLLSYEIDSNAAYFSNNHFNTKRYLIDNKGTFPSGLLKDVKAFIRENALKCSVIDARRKPTKHIALKAKYQHAPYDAQTKAVEAAVRCGHGTISMVTGAGKSTVIAMIINAFKLRTLVIVPNLELKKQLTESLQAIFGVNDHITVENIDSNALNSAKHYDVLIIDESHHSAASTYQKHNKKNWTGIYYRFFLTATPFRNNKDENLLFQAIAGEVIYTLGYKDAVKLGIVVPVEAYYIELDKVKTEAYTWAEVYSELVVNNEVRNNRIAELIKSLAEHGLSTLCLVKEIKHGTNLASLTGVPFCNGQDSDTRTFIQDFNSKRLTSLIGTTGVIGEGVDTKPCEFVIIAGLGKAKSAFMQQVGRALRTFKDKESCKIILIRDKSHRFTTRHFNEQCKVLKEEYGVTPLKLE